MTTSLWTVARYSDTQFSLCHFERVDKNCFSVPQTLGSSTSLGMTGLVIPQSTFMQKPHTISCAQKAPRKGRRFPHADTR
jgi:hypothetical protein